MLQFFFTISFIHFSERNVFYFTFFYLMIFLLLPLLSLRPIKGQHNNIYYIYILSYYFYPFNLLNRSCVLTFIHVQGYNNHILRYKISCTFSISLINNCSNITYIQYYMRFEMERKTDVNPSLIAHRSFLFFFTFIFWLIENGILSIQEIKNNN